MNALEAEAYTLLRPATLSLPDAIVAAMKAAKAGTPRMEMLNRLAYGCSREDRRYIVFALAEAFR
jgi:uncharacterized protein YbjT (DUF2867 family)